MQDPNTLLQQALALHQSGNVEQAAALYRQLAKRFPRNAQLLHLLGTAESQRGNRLEGIRLLEESIRIAPNNSEAHNNRAIVLTELNRLDEALRSFEQATRIDPENVGAHLGLADTLHSLSRYDDAVRSYERAVQLAPSNAFAHYSMGFNLQLLGRYREAMRSYELATRYKPDLGEAHWNRSLLKLLTGDFAEGWRLYEWRWQAASSRKFRRDFPHPLWLGQESIAGRTILVHAEAGLGDSIQFCRYLPMVERLGARIVLEIQSALVTLVSTLKCDFVVVHGGQEIPRFDVQCPMMSLPLAFGTGLDTIPAEVPYLHADPERQRRWRERLGAKTSPRVGLVWSGSEEHGNDRNRSIGLETLRPLFDLPIEFHSLQKEYRQADRELLGRLPQIRDHHRELEDLSDTAALIGELDLVISVDTSVAHLAGALGGKVWVLLPFVPDFRWLLDRSDSPWYPTATLFRQRRAGDWDDVIRQVRGELLGLQQTAPS